MLVISRINKTNNNLNVIGSLLIICSSEIVFELTDSFSYLYTYSIHRKYMCIYRIRVACQKFKFVVSHSL